MNKTIVVTTTINIPEFLELLCKNAKQHHKENISYIVIGDMKTPVEGREYCSNLANQFQVSIQYLDIPDQEKALENHRVLWDLMPLNDGVRKIIGNFLAYKEGCDRIIMIDDDNYATHNDYFEFHNRVGTEVQIQHIHSNSGWYNICETMIEKNRIPFYPRGFPWSERFKMPELTKEEKPAKMMVNGGFVLGDPDIDAVSRLFWPIDVVAFNAEYDPQFALAPGTWAPFNDQNTAISQEILPVYFKPPSNGRNADIWTSYVIGKLTEQMGDVVAFGQPLVRQIRNYHDLREDLAIEEMHNRTTDLFVTLLREVPLTEKSYIGALNELIEGCLAKVNSLDPSLASYEDQGYRHHQLPSETERQEAKQSELEMIRNFFLEYQTWSQFIASV